MRFLIPSCNTGNGHNSAAKALQECFMEHGSICDIRDAISFWSEDKSNKICNHYTFVSRYFPLVFRAYYHRAYFHKSKTKLTAKMYQLALNCVENLESFLNDNMYDGIICTHVAAL